MLGFVHAIFAAGCALLAIALAADSDHIIEGMPSLGGEGAFSFSLGILASLLVLNLASFQILGYVNPDKQHRTPEQMRVARINAWLTTLFLFNVARIPQDGNAWHVLVTVFGLLIGVIWLMMNLPPRHNALHRSDHDR